MVETAYQDMNLHSSRHDGDRIRTDMLFSIRYGKKAPENLVTSLLELQMFQNEIRF